MSEQRVSTPSQRLREKVRLLSRFRHMEEAARHKLIKFAWSGFLIVLLGIVMIAAGLILGTGAYSPEGLLIGFGFIVVIVGIIRMLIGFINPTTPADLPPEPATENVPTDLDSQLFEQEDTV